MKLIVLKFQGHQKLSNDLYILFIWALLASSWGNCGVICINFISGCVQSAKIQRETPRIYVTVINVDTIISVINTNLSIAPSVNPIINFKVRTFS